MNVRISFIAMNMAFALVLVVGALWAANAIYFEQSYFIMMFKYPWYQLTLSGDRGGSFLASVFPISQSKELESEGGGKALSIPVLVYHGIVGKAEGDNVTTRDFKEQMMALKDAGWETVSIEEFQAFMKGELQLSEKSFLLTFDDGRKDSYYPVDPILRALDYEAVMFVITNQSIGEKGKATHFYLSEKELKHMQSTGRWDIQSHGKFAHELYATGPNGETGHFYSNLLWVPEEERPETPEEFQERIYEDLRISKEEIEESLGISVATIAFPFGDFGHNLFADSNFELAKGILLISAKEHYSHGFYQWWEGEGFTFNYPREDVLTVKRLEVLPNWSGEALLQILEQGMSKSLPYQESFLQNNAWLSNWGSFDMQPGKGLVFLAEGGQAGASAVLDGTGGWEDYEVKARVNLPSQTGVFIWVRFQDANNNAACNFGLDFVHAEQVFKGEKRVIKGVRGVTPLKEGDFTVSARVQGRTIQCLVEGEIVVESTFLEPDLNRGGVGFKMWDEQIGKSQLLVRSLEVQPL
ncbi:MAG TPA: polysaccharide deacetylase family protein [Candidatus Paceibacterota bacterium]|nr:polysaccharide deacetylase family protein [Candidatus Paceibacterota bacterium]